MRKAPKSELTRLIEKKVDIPKVIEIPISTIRNVVTMIDFMAYARKVPVKKANLRTYEDFIKNLWNTFTHIAKNSNRIDIIFDLYLEGSIKQNERDRRKKSTPINVTICSTDQTLPVEMDSFWSSSKNKVELQMCFINWICKSYVDNKPVYLGGSHPEDITKCVKVCDGISEDIRLLKCDHEEADDRIMYHINHADIDIFICLIYHFTRCNFLNLQEIWMLCGQGSTKRSAEKFLVKVFNPKSSVNTFDELRYLYYHDKLFKFNVETMPPTSISIVDHIKRAYYQCHQWLNSPFIVTTWMFLISVMFYKMMI